jgi:hypothetical protein
MIPLYYVWRWNGTGWRPDNRDADGNMLSEVSLEAARARVAYLQAAHRKRRRRPMFPPPVVTLGEEARR